MVLQAPHAPLVRVQRLSPVPEADALLIRVEACGVCRTDLHVVDGELPQAHYPIVPGHEAVGIVEQIGIGVRGIDAGERVGIPWLASTCGQCEYCRENRENLCDFAQFTGCSVDGGYATHMVAKSAYCVRLDAYWRDPATTAPLLCAGLIGWRALNAAGSCRRLGIYGFGAAAHIVTQLACWQGKNVFAFTRPNDQTTQDFARSMGACWAGDASQPPPEPLDAAILFAPVGAVVPVALQAVRKGGRVVCAGIHMSNIPTFPYRLLWGERQLVSVANLTRSDAASFFHQAAQAKIHTRVIRFALSDANDALHALRAGRLEGAAVLIPDALARSPLGSGGFGQQRQPVTDTAISNAMRIPKIPGK